MSCHYSPERFDANLEIFIPYSKDFLGVSGPKQDVVAKVAQDAANAMIVELIQAEQPGYQSIEKSVQGAVTLAHAVFEAAERGEISRDEAKEYAARIADANLGIWNNRGSEAHLMYLGALEDLEHITYREDSYRFNSQGLPKIQTPFGNPVAEVA